MKKAFVHCVIQADFPDNVNEDKALSALESVFSGEEIAAQLPQILGIRIVFKNVVFAEDADWT